MKGNAYEEILSKISIITSGEIIEALIRAGYSAQELVYDFEFSEAEVARHICA